MSIYLSGEQSGLNRKIIAVTLLVFMSLAAAITPFAIVLGQNSQLGVSIIQVVPAAQANLTTQQQSIYNGSAGEAYNIKGTIYTSNGTYNVIIGNTIVASGTAKDTTSTPTSPCLSFQAATITCSSKTLDRET